MTAQFTINPFLTTVGNAGLFNVTSGGRRQGTADPDPSTIWALRNGYLAGTETLPMWGGVGIYESVPNPTNPQVTPPQTTGVIVGRATALTGSKALAGFSVFDQAYAMATSPQSTVPLAGSYMQVMSYRLGSGARIAVQCDPSIVSLRNGPIGPNGSQVAWDFVNQLLVPYVGTLTISSGTYNNTTGVVVLTMSSTITFAAGDAVVVSGLTGTGAFASLDGTWTTIATTSGTTVTYNAGAGLGASTITGGSLTLGSGSNQALSCSVLELNIGNSETVVYSTSTGFATWTFTGNTAVIQI
jgi:hypothetical protein